MGDSRETKVKKLQVTHSQFKQPLIRIGQVQVNRGIAQSIAHMEFCLKKSKIIIIKRKKRPKKGYILETFKCLKNFTATKRQT